MRGKAKIKGQRSSLEVCYFRSRDLSARTIIEHAYLRWCYTGRFATTIFSETRGSNVETILRHSKQCDNNVAKPCCAKKCRYVDSHSDSTVKLPRSCKCKEGKEKFYRKANFLYLGLLERFELHLQFSSFLLLQIGAIDANQTRVRKVLGLVGYILICCPHQSLLAQGAEGPFVAWLKLKFKVDSSNHLFTVESNKNCTWPIKPSAIVLQTW